jgi:hypothetical protein
MDHGLGDVDTRFLIADEAPPPGHPSEGSLDDPASWQNLEACFFVRPPDDLDGKIQEGGLVHDLSSIVGATAKEVLQPRPAFADGVKDRLGAGAVGDVGRGHCHTERGR